MSEISKYEAYKKKLDGICNENDLVFRFVNNTYPITLTIRPVSGLGEQMSLLESAEDDYISPDACIVFSFVDGAVFYKTYGRFPISETLFNKIKNLFKNMHTCWLQYFFRSAIQNGALKSGAMPVIDEAEAEDTEPAPEEVPEDSEDPDGMTFDEDLIKEATAIVRAENKATTSLLQRRLNLGFARASRLMDELERVGVIGTYNGSGPREVLPFDVPDDEEGGELDG